MNTQHTPGPWRAYEDAIINDLVKIAEVSTQNKGVINNWEANARLIAAAPELLKAAQTCQSIADRCNNAMLPPRIQELLKSIENTLQQAIRKATTI